MNIVRRRPTNIYRPAMNDNLCGLDRSLGDPSRMRKDPGATADRDQATAEVSECDQAKACVRGAQGREDEMTRKIQPLMTRGKQEVQTAMTNRGAMRRQSWLNPRDLLARGDLGGAFEGHQAHPTCISPSQY
jgi:hypothetical protein